jgi:hypothetical protein
VRCALSPNDLRVQTLVVALDRDDVPFAATWRAVGESAWKLGLPRPRYHLVRRLALGVRALRSARGGRRRAVAGVAAAALSPRVADVWLALARLGDAAARERLVLKSHEPPAVRPP